MPGTPHMLSSDDSEDDFSVGPDLATRLQTRLEPRATNGRHPTTTAPAQRPPSCDGFGMSKKKRLTEQIEIISSDEEEEERGENITCVDEVKSPVVLGGGCVKRPRAGDYDCTTDEEEDLFDVRPILPISDSAADNEACSDSDSLSHKVQRHQSSLGQRRALGNKHGQPTLSASMFGGAAVLSSMAPSQTVHSPSPPPLSKAEAKKKEVERRKQERERLKRDRLQEKERAKEMKELEKVAKKANSLVECTKWMAVHASGQLCSSPAGSQLAGLVSASDLQWQIMADPIVDEAITFAKVDPRSRQETPENLAIITLESEQFLRLVRNQQYPCIGSNGTPGAGHPRAAIGYTLSGRTVVDNSLVRPETFRYNCTLEEECTTWKQLLGVESLILFVWGLDDHFKKKKGSKPGGRGRKSRGNDDRPEPNRLDVETALTSIQIMHRVDHRFFSDARQLAEYVVHLAKAVAQAPYKREQLEDGAMFSSWYAEGSNVATVKVTPSGVGLRKLWQQQLRQFTSVGLETAQAIADAYPSPRLLLDAYEGLTSDEGSRLLADIPVRRGAGPVQTTRRLGPELSKKVHTFFTSTNPDKVLGS